MSSPSSTGRDLASFPWTRLGHSDLLVPRLGIGTVPLGNMLGPIGEEEAAHIIRRAHSIGARLYDAAPQYGLGLAERRLGATVPTLPRDEVVVATKVGRLLRRVSSAAKLRSTLVDARHRGWRKGVPRLGRNAMRGVKRALRLPTTARLGYPLERGADALDSVFDFTYDGTLRSIEESLQRLQLDRVDLVLVHDPDDHIDEALTGCWPALRRLREEKVVSAVGVGSNAVAPLLRLADEADFDAFLVAGRYTLLDMQALPELLPRCVERGISVIVGGVFNSGMLADPHPGQLFDYQQQGSSSKWLERAMRIQAVCARHGVPLAAAAIQFPLGHVSVSTVLTGVRSVSELEENAGMMTWPIPPDLWAELVAEGLLPADAPVPPQG
jgi:D-threo-aldose 1-dehydrogenase